jgi:outer membrane protein assembly factor BamB
VPSVSHPIDGVHGISRKLAWAVSGVVLVLAGVCTFAVYQHMDQPLPSDEAERAAKAYAAYKDNNFREAAALFGKLRTDFPQSEDSLVYPFMAELSECRAAIQVPQSTAEQARRSRENLEGFLGLQKTNQIIDKHYPGIAESMYRLVEEMSALALKDKDGDLLKEAEDLFQAASKYQVPPTELIKRITTGFAAATVVVSAEKKRLHAIEEVRAAAANPTYAAIEKVMEFSKDAELAADPEFTRLLGELPEQHRKSIVFDQTAAATSAGPGNGELAPSMALMASNVSRPQADRAASSRPVLALHAGVLYAFDPVTSSVRWVRRVGVDSVGLPLWIPATAATPELLLLCASENNALLALDGRDGGVFWRHPLPEPIVGTPLLIEGRAFVAGRGGGVYEIELAAGRCVGCYQLNQPLSHGGVCQPGTTLAYFAADRGCIYVLDLAARKCAAVVYSDHKAGSLRVPPLIVTVPRGSMQNGGKSGPPTGKLLLCRDDGNQGTELQALALPLPEGKTSLAAATERLQGRICFSPFFDGENVSLVTDAGVFAIFGIRQRDDRDLFLLHKETLPISFSEADRPQILHADGQNFWVFAQGRLRQFQVGINLTQGSRLTSRAIAIPPLGPTLHQAIMQTDEHGRPFLYFTAEGDHGRGATISAVDLEAGGLAWQRSIGLALSGEPAVLRGSGKVVVADQRGSVLILDPSRRVDLPSNWQLAPRPVPAELQGLTGQVTLIHSADGTAVAIVATSLRQLKAWLYEGDAPKTLEAGATLDAAPAGLPILVGETIIQPLASGRLALLKGGEAFTDSPWRSNQAESTAVCHAVPLAGGMLAATDGSRGLVLWQVNGRNLAKVKSTGDSIKARILSAPAVLPGANQPRLAVADAARTVTLLEGPGLQRAREWILSDDITAGPFAIQNGILVVLGRRRLVWLDPDKNQTVWAWTCPDGDIVGHPRILDGRLLVADQSGKIRTIDPATGTVELRYELQGDVAPACAGVPWGADRLFVPLTDGTALLPKRQ